ncbi:MAG: carbon-nitrogen hydrolase family protein [Gammaproteobacteria bacterium]|nr:carbon-nitrogen hydrolase family protein [Gammaproteobacteria bacterium]MDP2141673.1 carbon-nitrogen hydrolase family protein [Gammaproteobacteria bacterium]MDP2347908.1 carbon-nitrogen hydrolase family protein [Gammaproteobacteria bacterium]
MDRKAAVVQMVSSGNIHANLASAERLIGDAAAAGAVLVVLPENFAVLDGGPLSQYAESEGDTNALLQGFLAKQARKHSIILVAGTMPMATRPTISGGAVETVTDGRVRPSCLVYSPEGLLMARYDKMHLFDVEVADKQAQYMESRSFESGDRVVTLATPLGKLGLSICYDLRFPELYRRLLEEGTEIITVPSAFTNVTGEAHWEVLLRARAIENQCYVVAANQGGLHNASRETYGHSMIVDPWGRVVARVEKGEGIAVAEIDLDQLHELRRKMPVQSHRRL